MKSGTIPCSCESRNPTAPKAGLLLSQEHEARETGFTLIELLVALLIFGMLSAAGVGLLSFSVTTQDRAAARMDEIGQLSRMGALLTGDLAQAAPRASRDENGQLHPAFSGGSAPLLAFVRAGWENPDAATRASLQKVEYRLSGDRLERIAYPHVDGAMPLPPVTLVDGVRTVRLRFRAENGAWLDRWIPQQAYHMPKAVEIEVDTARDGTLRQLFLVGGA